MTLINGIGLLFQPKVLSGRKVGDDEKDYADLKDMIGKPAQGTAYFKAEATKWLIKYVNNSHKQLLTVSEAVKSGNRSVKGADIALALGITDFENFLLTTGSFTQGKIDYYKADAYRISGNYSSAITSYRNVIPKLQGDDYRWAVIGLFDSELQRGDAPGSIVADFQNAYAVHPNQDRFARDTVAEFASRYLKREDLDSLTTALAIYEAMSAGATLPSPLTGYPTGSGGSASINFPKTIVGLKIKIARIKKDVKALDDALSYALNARLFDEAKWALWEKIDLPYKNSPESIPDRMQLALLLMVSFANDGKLSLSAEPWKTIAAMDIPNKKTILSAGIKPDKTLKDRLSLAYVLGSISTISKKYGLESTYDVKFFKEASVAEYARCENLALDGIRKKPAEVDNYLDLANVYMNMGTFMLDKYQESRDEGDRTQGLKLLNKAGAIYQAIIGGDFALSSPDLGEVDSYLKQNAAALRKAIGDKKKDKDRQLATINYITIALQTKLKFSDKPAEITNVYKQAVKMLRDLRASVSDDQIRSQIDGSIIEANQLFATAFIKLEKPELIFSLLEQNVSDIFADRSVPKGKLTEIFGGTDVSWKAFFKNPEDVQLEFKDDAEATIAKSSIDGAKKKKLLTLLHKYLEKEPDYTAALGNISILAWAHEVYGEKIGDKEHYRIAAAIYKALLYGESTTISGVKTLVDLIIKNRDNIMKDNTLKTARKSAAELHFALAKDLKELDDIPNATKEYQEAIKLFKEDTSAQGQYKLLDAQAGFLAFRVKNLIEDKKYEEAFALINSEDLKVMEENIKRLALPGNLEDIFNSYSTLAWLYGMKGSLEDKIAGEGAGKDSNLQAVRIYKMLLADPKISDDVFLTTMKTSRAGLYISIGGHLQAAGVQDEALLGEAAGFFDKAIELIKKEDQDKPSVQMKKAKAYLGDAESLLRLSLIGSKGKSPQEISNNFNKIFGFLTEAFEALSRVDLKSVDQLKEGLRFIKTFNWALSLKADYLMRTDNQYYPGKVYPEKAMLLIINRVLLKGDNPDGYSGKWSEIYASAKTGASAMHLDLSKILRFIQKNRAETGGSKFLSEAVLSSFGANSWSMRLEYIGNLLSAELYQEAVDEYNVAVDLIGKQKSFGQKELEFLTNIHAAIGDIFCFKMGRLSEARQAYDKSIITIAASLAKAGKKDAPATAENALKFINGNLDLLSQTGQKELLDTYLRILNGYGKIYLENDETDKAVESHKKVIGILTSETLPSGIRNDPKFTNTLITAYLSLADIYNYKLNDDGEALKYYNLARVAGEKIADKSAADRYTAQAYAGIGDIYRLRKFDHKAAIEQYDKGIKLLEGKSNLDNEEKKLLCQLYANKAVSLAQTGDFKGAAAMIMQARSRISMLNTEFDPTLQKTKDRIENSLVLINQRNLSGLSSIEFRGAYVVDSYQNGSNSTRTSGFVPMFSADIKLYSNFSLKLDYVIGLERELQFKTAGLAEPATRLTIDRPHTISAKLRYNYDGDRFNFRIAPSMLVNVAGYTVNGFAWNPDKSSYSGITPDSSIFYATYLALSLGMDYKLSLNEKSLMMFGFDLDGSVRIAGNNSPLIAASKQDIGEFSDPTKVDIDGAKKKADDDAAYTPADRFSFAFNPYARYLYRFNLGDAIVNSSFMLGFGVERNPQAITVNGLWPLNRDRGYWRGYGSAAADLSFFFGNEKRWNIPFGISGKAGNIMYIQGETGVGYIGDGWGLKGVLGISHFDDTKSSQNTTYSVGLGGFF